MWDTEARVPFEASLLSERSDGEALGRLLELIACCPGITVDELDALRLPGLYAGLRFFYRTGLIRTSTTPPRFFDRATRIYATSPAS